MSKPKRRVLTLSRRRKKRTPPTASSAPIAPPAPDEPDYDIALVEEPLLVMSAQRGLAAFAELARRHRPYMLRTARAILRNDDDAEDAVQESLLVALTNVATYAPARGGVERWLAGIARKRCKTMLRERQRAGLSLDQVQTIAAQTNLDEFAEQQEQLSRLARAIQHLPKLQRATVELAAMQRSHRDISFALGITPHAVTMNLTRARRTLRATLGVEGASG